MTSTAWSGGGRSRLPRNWSSSIVPAILRRDPTCRLSDEGCWSTSTEVDHIGDRNDHRLDNLRGVCKPCHEKRTAQQAAEAVRVMRMKAKYPNAKHPGLR